MTLVNSHLANIGRRLAGVNPYALAPQAPGRASADEDDAHMAPLAGLRRSADSACASKTRDRGTAPPLPPGGGAAFELTLAEPVQAILLLAAKASGLSHGEAVARAIVFWAQEAVGMPGLLSALTPQAPGGASADADDARLGLRPLAEMTRVPDFDRGGGNRFQDCGGP